MDKNWFGSQPVYGNWLLVNDVFADFRAWALRSTLTDKRAVPNFILISLNPNVNDNNNNSEMKMIKIACCYRHKAVMNKIHRVGA